ncbi:hypothetical protein PUN28_018850 [Cardiocondyla obscurior]|uniref:Uncharacterized protein n=1 Tax=Cardiocondyla obscurior TaxID=286306 RepID=A0AAW2EGE2_9HYME
MFCSSLSILFPLIQGTSRTFQRPVNCKCPFIIDIVFFTAELSLIADSKKIDAHLGTFCPTLARLPSENESLTIREATLVHSVSIPYLFLALHNFNEWFHRFCTRTDFLVLHFIHFFFVFINRFHRELSTWILLLLIF